MAKEIVSEKNDKGFDEQTLAKVLEAAYVLQEHNREVREREARQPQKVIATAASASSAGKTIAVDKAVAAATAPAAAPPKVETRPTVRPDYAVVLGQIVETQQKIQAEHLELEYAMLFIAERATEIAQAAGAGIGLLTGGKVQYRAAAGAMALPIDSQVSMEKALCSACLRVGQVIRCNDVNTEFLVDVEECRRRGIEAMIAAPIHSSGNVVGALELYYGNTDAFTEPDVHTCQLMAGLVAESLARSEGRDEQIAVDLEVPSEAGVLDKVVENLEGPVQMAALKGGAAQSGVTTHRDKSSSIACRKCGSDLVPDEQFCGECGWPSGSDYQAVRIPGHSASLWKTQPTAKVSPENGNGDVSPNFPSEEAAVEFLRKELPELFGASGSLRFEAAGSQQGDRQPALGEMESAPAIENSDLPDVTSEKSPIEGEIVAAEETSNWTSAAAAREFLEGFVRRERHGTLGKFLRARRGDIYLAVAIILIFFAIRWGVGSNNSVDSGANPATTSHHKPGADLPLYDRVLISLGLAEAPAPPEYKGNPNSQVWVDTQSGLYYCPGADLYGKTAKGRLTTQHDAQLDQYEPAARKPCD